MKLLTTFVCAFGLASITLADAPAKPDAGRLTAAIDELLLKALTDAKRKPSPPADDAEFLRRAYLDITGRIPTAEKAAAFLDSTDPAKRAKLIDELLASPEYGQNFAIIWRTSLIKRDEANLELTPHLFTDWLAKSFNDNRGWDAIVTDMLTADGSTESNPQGLFFLVNRDMRRIDPPKVVGAAANLFMGIQLQCAECHNHPFIKEWKQNDFWALAAFFSRTRDVGPAGKPAITSAVISETIPPVKKPSKNAPAPPPPIPLGSIAIPNALEEGKIVGIVKGKFFEADEPALDEKPFRPVLAQWLVSPKNKYFARAAVNRMWGHLFGQGIVNPIDDMSKENPPSHPELLERLAEDFIASGHDLKFLIRAIAGSQTYQRTSRQLPENKADEAWVTHMKMKVMNAEVLYDSLSLALGTDDLVTPPAPNPKSKNTPPTSRQLFIGIFDTRQEGDDPAESGHGIPQFLRLMNSPNFNRGSPLVDELIEKKVGRKGALERLFLATLSRRPTPAEIEKVNAYITRQNNLKQAYADVLWVLVNTGEFMTIR